MNYFSNVPLEPIHKQLFTGIAQKVSFRFLERRRWVKKQFYVFERKEKEYQVDQILCSFYVVLFIFIKVTRFILFYIITVTTYCMTLKKETVDFVHSLYETSVFLSCMCIVFLAGIFLAHVTNFNTGILKIKSLRPKYFCFHRDNICSKRSDIWI